MQIPNDLNDTERQLCECVFLLMAALIGEQTLGYAQENSLSNMAVGVSAKILIDIIGDQEYNNIELFLLAQDVLNKYGHD